MTYQIDAWLDRPNPRLRVTDTLMDSVVIDWEGKKCYDMLADCGVEPQDLLSNHHLNDIVHDLLLGSFMHIYRT